jgi:N-acetylmuramoyl-L-alanine amidase
VPAPIRPLAALLLSLLTVPPAGAPAKHLVFLDPGHTPRHPGAVGAAGVAEVTYNDAAVEVLAKALVESGELRTQLSRQPGEEIALRKRAELANQAHADVFIAVHHDSANERYLETVQIDGKVGHRALPALRQRFNLGFSLFVSEKNPRFQDSLRLARAIGTELLALGRTPSTHHTEVVPNEGRTFLDPKLGVYRYDDLNVLEHAQMPALLIEVAVIVDEQELAYVDAPESRAQLAKAVTRAVQSYFAR